MQQVSSPPVHGFLILYDALGHMLWLSGTLSPYHAPELIGRPAWHSLSGRDIDTCQAAILRCIESNEPQIIDVTDAACGLWRVWLYPARVGKVRIVGICRPFPQSVLRLTDRELEVCRLLASGIGSKAIAAKLKVTRSTIDNHRRHISQKLRIESCALESWCGHYSEWF